MTLKDLTWMAIRYVDNRMVLTFCHKGNAYVFEDLLKTNFYGETIILEPEPRECLVGIDLVYLCKCVQSLAPFGNIVEARLRVPGYTSDDNGFDWNNFWRYRSPKSAGSRSNNLSSFLTRLHLATTLSFPAQRQRQAVARLLWVYRAIGFDGDVLFKALLTRASYFTAGNGWWATIRSALIDNPSLLHTFAS